MTDKRCGTCYWWYGRPDRSVKCQWWPAVSPFWVIAIKGLHDTSETDGTTCDAWEPKDAER